MPLLIGLNCATKHFVDVRSGAAGDRLVGTRSPDGAAVEGVHVETGLPQPGRLQ